MPDSAVVFQTGGTVNCRKAVYVTRRADEELLAACRRLEFANVLAPRQMGKSSLMERTRQLLEQEGFVAATYDLSGSSDEDRFYGSLRLRLGQRLAWKSRRIGKRERMSGMFSFSRCLSIPWPDQQSQLFSSSMRLIR